MVIIRTTSSSAFAHVWSAVLRLLFLPGLILLWHPSPSLPLPGLGLRRRHCLGRSRGIYDADTLLFHIGSTGGRSTALRPAFVDELGDLD